MIVRSLFIKIFLWFWLSITIIIGALALVIWLYPYNTAPITGFPENLHELQVRGALAVYESQGINAFKQHRQRLESASHFKTYFVDEQDNELTGETVPAELLQFAKQNEEQLKRGEHVKSSAPPRLIIPMTCASGHFIRALVEPDRPFLGLGSLSTTNNDDHRPPHDLDHQGHREPDEDHHDSINRTNDSQSPPDTTAPSATSRPQRGPGHPHGPPPEAIAEYQLLVPGHALWIRLSAMVLAAGLGCYALARYLTSPVRRLQHTARQLASGDLTARVGSKLASRHDEIGELGRDFDRMAGQVETLLTTHQRLLRDVSHELRSPLARLNVALELASRDAGPQAAPNLGRVRREAERLNELIGQLLMLARLDGSATQSAIAQTKINLQELIHEVASDAEFEAAALDRHVRLTHVEACSTMGSPELLRSALENVMRNAVHYTKLGSEVEVALHYQATDHGEPASALIEIRDHGPGVPEESLSQIFQPFYRVSDARDRKSGGVGLGLAITERAINFHGGTIQASNAPKGGLIVRITLPCVK